MGFSLAHYHKNMQTWTCSILVLNMSTINVYCAFGPTLAASAQLSCATQLNSPKSKAAALFFQWGNVCETSHSRAFRLWAWSCDTWNLGCIKKTRYLCYTSTPLGNAQAIRTFFDWGRRAWHLRLGLGICKPTVKLDCIHKVRLWNWGERLQRYTKHTMFWALWCWVVMAGSATIFQDTCFNTSRDLFR